MKTETVTPKKETILAALSAFARQRPGLDFRNYGDFKCYNSELRSITRTLGDFRQLYRQVELSSISAETLLESAKRAYSGRLSFIVKDNGSVGVDYCTGQYWPTEYRCAACAVLAAALWDRMRGGVPDETRLALLKLSPGSWIRREFRRQFGRGIASRWFN